jgi:hypothetical protein
MPSPLFRPPRHLIKEWPEVFEDLYMNTMPIAYLEFINLEFYDGRIWEIDIISQVEKLDHEEIAERLLDTIQEYKDEIKKIHFKIDVDRLKNDIQNSTKDFL